MNLSVTADGAVLIQPKAEGQALAPADFAEKAVTVTNEPAFYVALGADGLMARSVGVTQEDRKVVAALVGNWIAEGFLPTACDVKTYGKHVRNLVAANKPPATKIETASTGAADGSAGSAGAAEGSAGAAPASGDQAKPESTDGAKAEETAAGGKDI